MNKLSVNALGVGVGAMWAVSVFFFGIAAMFGWGVALVGPLSSLYIGFGASFLGAIIGAIWAFVDGYIGGAIIAWVYNRLAR
jgi:hypothetical protein